MKTFLLLYKSRVLTTIAGLLTLVGPVQDPPLPTEYSILVDAYHLSKADIPNDPQERRNQYPYNNKVFTPDRPLSLFKCPEIIFYYYVPFQYKEFIRMRRKEDGIIQRSDIYRRSRIGQDLGFSYMCIKLTEDERIEKHKDILEGRTNGILVCDILDPDCPIIQTFEYSDYNYYELQSGDLIKSIAGNYMADRERLSAGIQVLNQHLKRTNQDEPIAIEIVTVKGEKKDLLLFPKGKEGVKYLEPEK